MIDEHTFHRSFNRQADALARKHRDAWICQDFLAGKPVKDIATEMNLTRERVRQVLRAAGIPLRRPVVQ